MPNACFCVPGAILHGSQIFPPKPWNSLSEVGIVGTDLQMKKTGTERLSNLPKNVASKW